MSIAWSRIFPNADDPEPNEEWLQFYDNVFDECLKYGIEPLVTMSNYEPPINLVLKYNGWYNRKTIDMFVRFVETICTRYKDKVKYWMTFNEINNQANYNSEGSIFGNSGIVYEENECREKTMYQAAYAFEQATDFHTKKPVILGGND